jgi:hypothetical protein
LDGQVLRKLGSPRVKRYLLAFVLSLGLFLPSTQLANAGDGVLFISTDRLEGYDRTLFKHWIDADKNGCDTRSEVLIKEAKVISMFKNQVKLIKNKKI